jgi:LysR family transcriptional regulator for metE and metH
MNDITLAAPSRLETRDLRLVVALARARTTAAAGKILHLTQPAVSRALVGLEQRLDATLFERTPRGLEPTHAGRTLLASAPSLLQELNALEAQLQQALWRKTTVLRRGRAHYVGLASSCTAGVAHT